MKNTAEDTGLPRFEGYPKGWFVIGFSDEYQRGDVKKLQYFNQALVAFRDDEGVLQVKDSYCPHLGAHLGAQPSRSESAVNQAILADIQEFSYRRSSQPRPLQ